MAIKFYKSTAPYGFLNNFWKARMFVFGRWWNWVEAPYQAAKTISAQEQQKIWEATKPIEARNLGQKVKLIDDWDRIKRHVMKDCVLAKFLQHSDLRKQLMETGDEELIENSPIDWWWGCGKDGAGRNELGKILMEVRQMLQGE